ncbi:MAG: 5,6-dimethylbenzimidazole synthase [Methylocystis sp.]
MAADAPEMKDESHEAQLAPAEAFSEAERAAIYRVIHSRRDVRDEFLPDDVPREVLLRILDAAHHAPSVGFMQPWNFIIVKDIKKRRTAYEAFQRACEAEEETLAPERRSHYRGLKLQGIMKAPLNICVTCDRARFGVTGLGRSQQPDTDILSTACAVQNLWLAARAEGVGVGWVSIVREADLRQIFNIPNEIAIIAYLCVGYVAKTYRSPELEVKRWASRLPLENLIFEDSWGQLADSTNLP